MKDQLKYEKPKLIVLKANFGINVEPASMALEILILVFQVPILFGLVPLGLVSRMLLR